MDQALYKRLRVAAAHIRLSVIEGTHSAKSGHPGGSLSIADTLAYLYEAELNIDPQNPDWPNRDRLVLSKGHAAPALYGALAYKGYFPQSEIPKLRSLDGFLQGHPDMKGTPGVDMSTGSLGQGVSAAAGMALAAKIDGAHYRVYAILGDGEIEEGQVWEALMFASHKKLTNLCVIIDNNGLQIDGPVDKVNSPYPIPEKCRAFGFHTLEIDGHDFDQLEAAFKEARETTDRPTAIVLKTVKGKGVSFMENQVSWHGSAPNDEQYEQAKSELEAALEAAQAL